MSIRYAPEQQDPLVAWEAGEPLQDVPARVRLHQPQDGDTFTDGDAIQITAEVTEGTTPIDRVEATYDGATQELTDQGDGTWKGAETATLGAETLTVEVFDTEESSDTDSASFTVYPLISAHLAITDDPALLDLAANLVVRGSLDVSDDAGAVSGTSLAVVGASISVIDVQAAFGTGASVHIGSELSVLDDPASLAFEEPKQPELRNVQVVIKD